LRCQASQEAWDFVVMEAPSHVAHIKKIIMYAAAFHEGTLAFWDYVPHSWCKPQGQELHEYPCDTMNKAN